ncbi:PD-(D/E)XK nuclease family protein [Brassicibacter mesophilus]|uniref:PDDEXK-like family protein n=1 Tax=Brassicibacter mesophilus TaxID=745119 RepID=UPI003D1BBA36
MKKGFDIINYQSLLSQINTIIEKYNTVQKETGGFFNIFSILNMERLEVQTHSAFIFELLNPEGSHNQGIEYLKIFINDILEIDDFDFTTVKVERERSIGSLGRIDLVIENKDNIFIIEIKIDAGDQRNQLKRYNEYALKTGKQYYIYYLTLIGVEASEFSVGDSDIVYQCISFKHHIIEWINECICSGRTPLLPIIRETLNQYSKLIEKITNTVDEGLKMEIKELLLRGNNLEIAEQLAQVIPYAKAELEYNFWMELHKNFTPQIEALGYKFIDDGFFKDNNEDIEEIVSARSKKSGDIYFEYLIGKYNEQKLILCIGNSGYDNHLYIMLVLYNGENERYIKYTEYDEGLLEAIEDLGFDKNSNYKYTYLNHDLNFHSNGIVKLTSEDYLIEAVNQIGNQILEIVKNINSNIELKNLLSICK